MINRQALLADLQKFLQRIEADLLERSESTEVPEVPVALHAEYENAAKAERTAQNYEDWRTDTITQAAAAWVLSCVFVRFLEDNSIVDPPKIAGRGERLARARDEHELYFRSHPQHTDREYLLSIFGELAKFPGTKGIFGEHNAINDLSNWLSGDAAGELLNFFQKIDASTGALVHDFTDPNWDTRFLGDLYQDLSEAARKKFALLQTPDFVEEFILDRTLEPAIDEFGLVTGHSQPTNDEGQITNDYFKMIDPACGSGHFLLGAFSRLLDRWQRKEPGTNIRELTQRALNSVHGVDINPFAVAIAKFRLLLAAMKSCDIRNLADAPVFEINVACGDSLLHGENRTSTGQNLMDFADGATDQELYAHAYPGEDLQKVRALLRPGTYHCVVANPPYIVPTDRKQNDWYRKRFSACHMKYSLAVPFMQQIFQLATQGGFTGQITANSFMKREFGKKLIESFFPTVDLTHVIDTSGGGGAHIPGHTTGTVIIFGRQRKPGTSTVRAVMGIRGEPSTPADPARGLVWLAIIGQVDRPESKSEFVSVSDSAREMFHKHPWSIGGGGAAELKELLDFRALQKLGAKCDSIGITSFTLEDDIYFLPRISALRCRIRSGDFRTIVVGDVVRDWVLSNSDVAIFPYDEGFRPINEDWNHPTLRFLWIARACLANNKMFGGKTKVESGLRWYEYGRLTADKLRTPLSIVFAAVATHNHFVLDRGGKVFNRSAPVIKFSSDTREDDILILLGLLNSSTACFWMKQVFMPKATAVGDISIEKGKPEANRYDFAATGLQTFPLPFDHQSADAVLMLRLVSELDRAAAELQEARPEAILAKWRCETSDHLSDQLAKGRSIHASIYNRMIALQEELDWEVYRIYGLSPEGADPLILQDCDQGISADQRPFCWSGDTAPTSVPERWRTRYEFRRKIALSKPELAIIEDCVFKRPWWGRQGVYGRLTRDYEGWTVDALCGWLQDRLESYLDFDGRQHGTGDAATKLDIALVSVARLSDIVRQDAGFLSAAELYRNDPAFDVQALVEELVLAENVPHLPALRYKDSGLRKRAEWEKTWDMQRHVDAGEAVGLIPVPPKYTNADFISTGGARYWSLRGKLDVPKERWISFPHCEGPDGTLVICWAGYDHLQQAQAISAYYVRVQTEFGGSDDPRLIPLLASLIELLPWLKQWHNEPNANFDGLRMGDYFDGFVNEEARNMGKTLQEIKDWVPPKKVAKTAAPKSSTKKTSKRKVAEEASQAEGDD